jgi:CelD/BcsL family acetyltransferase involved in cellulose biosynthesis
LVRYSHLVPGDRKLAHQRGVVGQSGKFSGREEGFPYLACRLVEGKIICAHKTYLRVMPQPVCIPERLGEQKRFRPVKPAELRVELIPGRRLTKHHMEAWRELQRSNPDLANPCFSPEFTQSVAAVRSDVEVAWIRQGKQLLAIFPFQRKSASRAVPVGGIVSDYHGLICGPDFYCDPRDILKSCGLVAWDFDRLLASQNCFAPFHKLTEPSAIIDLSEGFTAYAEERRAAGTRQIEQCVYLIRRLRRELGPVRFVAHDDDPARLDQVLRWKSEQYQRSRWPDLFGTEWGRGLVHQIHRVQKPGFGGMLSLLYAGDWLVAGHIGMRSESVWHYWFPAYDRRFARFSPGMLLLLNMAQHAEDLGLRSIDIGTGITLYKKRLMNSSIPVAEGSVERPSCLHLLRTTRRKLSRWMKAFRKQAD